MNKAKPAEPSYFISALWAIMSFFIPALACAAEGDFLSKFHPYISVQETYNDNIELTRDNKRDDFITTVSPGLKFSTMDKSTEPTGIDLDYRLGLVFYNRDTDKNYVSHSGNLFAKYNTKEHWSFSIRDSFTRSDEPRERQYFTAPEESQYVLATRHDRRVYWRNVVAPNVEYRFGREDKVGINYRNNIYRGLTEGVENSREDNASPYIDFWFNQNNGIHLEYGYTKGDFESSPDFSGHKGTFRYTYRFNPRTSTFLEYDYSRKNFDISTSDYDVHEGYLGITQKFSAVFSGEAQAGYFAQRRDTGSNNEGFSYKGSLSYIQKLTTFGMRAQGGYTEDYFTAENLGFNKYHRVTGFVNHSLAPRFSIGANGNLERADFLAQNHVDWIWGVGATASYLPFKWLSLALDVSHRQRTSNVDAYDYTENRVTLSLTATY